MTSPVDEPNLAGKIISQVEIWQSQSYWPIKGWASPLSGGIPHYSCNLLPGNGSTENFPDDISAPPGWHWADKWTLDISSRFGHPDFEGWFYASSFDRVNVMIRNANGNGSASKTSVVRKRRWLRTILCTAPELCQAIHQRIDQIILMRKNIEATLKDKESSVKNVKFYEENRSFVFSQSLHLATQGTLNTLTMVKDLGVKLKLLKQYIYERVSMEREYMARYENLTKKYLVTQQQTLVTSRKNNQRLPFTGMFQEMDSPTTYQVATPTVKTPGGPGPSEPGSTAGKLRYLRSAFSPANSSMAGDQQEDQEQQDRGQDDTAEGEGAEEDNESGMGGSPTHLREQAGAGSAASSGAGYAAVDNAELFFLRLSQHTSLIHAHIQQEYSNNLLSYVATEMDQMILEITTVLKEARTSFRKNSDICRLSESAIRNFLTSVHIAHESSVHHALRVINDLSEELNGLRGGLPYEPAYFQYVRNAVVVSLTPTGAALALTNQASSSQSGSSGGGIGAAAGAASAAAAALLSSASASTLTPIKSRLVNLATSAATGGGGGGGSAASSPILVSTTNTALSMALASSTNAGAYSGGGSGSNSMSSPGGHQSTALVSASAAAPIPASTTSALHPTLSNHSLNNHAQSSHGHGGGGTNRSRDDLWLAIQRYKVAVRDSQEALCVLISESMDLELQQQIFANRVHYLFANMIRNYLQEENHSLMETASLWQEMMKEIIESMSLAVKLPYPVIQSPFQQLNITLGDMTGERKRARQRRRHKGRQQQSAGSKQGEGEGEAEDADQEEDDQEEGDEDDDEDDNGTAAAMQRHDGHFLTSPAAVNHHGKKSKSKKKKDNDKRIVRRPSKMKGFFQDEDELEGNEGNKDQQDDADQEEDAAEEGDADDDQQEEDEEDGSEARADDDEEDDEDGQQNNGGNGHDSTGSGGAGLDMMNYAMGLGIFSFTSLYQAPLPASPGVVRSGSLLYTTATDFLRTSSKSLLSAGIWKTAYLVATTDGYLHILLQRKYEIPDRSFYLQETLINETARDFQHQEANRLIFELSLMNSSSGSSSTGMAGSHGHGHHGHGQHRASSGSTVVTGSSSSSHSNSSYGSSHGQHGRSSSISNPAHHANNSSSHIASSSRQHHFFHHQESLFFRCDTFEECQEWIHDLQHLHVSSGDADREIEKSVRQAMMQSLPILKGETAKIDLELQKYELMQQAHLNFDVNSSQQQALLLQQEQQEEREEQAAEQAEQAANKAATATLSGSKAAAADKATAGQQQVADNMSMQSALDSSSSNRAATAPADQKKDGGRAEDEEANEESRLLDADELLIVDTSLAGDDNNNASYSATALSSPMTPGSGITATRSASGTSAAYLTSKANLRQRAVADQQQPQPHRPVGAVGSNSRSNSQTNMTTQSYAYYGTSHPYQQQQDSWQRPPMTPPGGSQHVQPKQIIPKLDKDVPLAKRHTTLIAQYEQGLQLEKAKVQQRVLQTRDKRLKDVVENIPFLPDSPVPPSGAAFTVTAADDQLYQQLLEQSPSAQETSYSRLQEQDYLLRLPGSADQQDDNNNGSSSMMIANSFSVDPADPMAGPSSASAAPLSSSHQDGFKNKNLVKKLSAKFDANLVQGMINSNSNNSNNTSNQSMK